jgi:uncharacterized protein with HEPN domain
MLAAARAAREYAAAMTDRADLRVNQRSRHAILHDLFVLGEAAKAVPAEFRAQHPEVEWRRVAGLRDVLAHEYFGVDDEVIWDVVKNKLAELVAQLEKILA